MAVRTRTAQGVLLLLASWATLPAARAEDCWHGPSGITSQLGQLVTITTPPGGSVTVNFDFNALWENELFICDEASHQVLGVRGNTRDRSTWASPAAPAGQTHNYVLAAFHKTVSASAGDAGDHPWIQSPKKDLTRGQGPHPQVEQYGFSDQAVRDHRDDNVLITVTYNGNRSPAPSVTLTVNPTSIPLGSSAKLQWHAQDAKTCSGTGSGNGDWTGGSIDSSATVQPRLPGTQTYRITCRGSTPPAATATVTLDVTKVVRRPMVKIPADGSQLFQTH